MTQDILIFGYGPVGRATAELLASQGRACRVAQRRAPDGLPALASFASADALDAQSVRRAAQGVAQIVIAIGLAYSGKVWRDSWPRAMRNILAAALETKARVVFVDNLYMYGPQDAPLVETMPLVDFGVKPAVRAQITRLWQESRVTFAALRAPDFYGPGVGNSHLGDAALGALATGRATTVVVPPDAPHDFAYVPDFARGVVALLDAPDTAYGQAWHLPCAPTRSLRELIAIGAGALGVAPRIRRIPPWLMGPASLFAPILGELGEMSFQWDRPYRVDARRFAAAFAFEPTPIEVGVKAAALSFRA